jgi:hypothetical protein
LNILRLIYFSATHLFDCLTFPPVFFFFCRQATAALVHIPAVTVEAAHFKEETEPRGLSA